MFQRIIDDFKASAASALQQMSLAAAAAIAFLIMAAFLCAAGFIAVMHNYGAVEACFAGAALFFVLMLIAAVSYLLRKRRIEARAEARAKAAKSARSMLADPMVVTAGLQLARSVGLKKMIPLLALAGLALGLMSSRSHAANQTPAE